MTSLISHIHYFVDIIFQKITSFLLTEAQHSTTPSFVHLPFSTSLLSTFNPFTSLSISYGQFLNSVSPSSAFSLIHFETALFNSSRCYICFYSQHYFYASPCVHLLVFILSPPHSTTVHLLFVSYHSSSNTS